MKGGQCGEMRSKTKWSGDNQKPFLLNAIPDAEDDISRACARKFTRVGAIATADAGSSAMRSCASACYGAQQIITQPSPSNYIPAIATNDKPSSLLVYVEAGIRAQRESHTRAAQKLAETSHAERQQCPLSGEKQSPKSLLVKCLRGSALKDSAVGIIQMRL
ncbi:hypothetical protein COEREDRAFT_8809 [Coemansia reversa NRRL 1564]|uniref:Uncharacterized protein n=1 Tax=Coemansia reversa (strain ATCC 12441 / NRRL 1564) TaxID=763665 RepID=A0A2G5BAY3_COERN|nr:hypothetical protein COEREDRAFT_8809 [Coemansia reversa NRRL 1564]|eukprot:PIA16152.1 hypothetical protein COEREDRAFT_8809 [Coemansia reversa NRRL 1564]